ncbi:hypothetical protein GCM10012275_51110 [Longimycelium tulufanense]|uniref:Uncharacterized protein n=1 Tax=Longimycelium tulufanense TaxID=907463 RepID=A0A8J3FY94_9PSEU|nr:hypothetical protein [Longimycelium tulufanense]GGM74178.1 hypothetical protein GCM10012275_51110 [Longimycelium tulufanense]
MTTVYRSRAQDALVARTEIANYLVHATLLARLRTRTRPGPRALAELRRCLRAELAWRVRGALPTHTARLAWRHCRTFAARVVADPQASATERTEAQRRLQALARWLRLRGLRPDDPAQPELVRERLLR